MTVSSLVKALLVASDRNLFPTNVSKKKVFIYLFIYLKTIVSQERQRCQPGFREDWNRDLEIHQEHKLLIFV